MPQKVAIGNPNWIKGCIPWNKGTGKEKYCLDCTNLLPTSSRYPRNGITSTRCRQCWYKSTRIDFTPHPNSLKALKPKSAEWLQEHKIHLGHKHSEGSKKLISENRKGKMRAGDNFAWKGDKVGYGALHSWVARELGKPDTCEHCRVSGLFGHEIQWANKSGEYKRDLTDWLRLCVSCHSKYDGIPQKMWQTRRAYV